MHGATKILHTIINMKYTRVEKNNKHALKYWSTNTESSYGVMSIQRSFMYVFIGENEKNNLRSNYTLYFSLNIEEKYIWKK